jgi:transcription elongation factor GreA
MADKYPMTKKGLTALKEELKQRKEHERHRIVRAIEEARAHGDLSENAEYSAAKEAQSHNEGRIGKLEELVALADVVDPVVAVREQSGVRSHRLDRGNRLG